MDSKQEFLELIRSNSQRLRNLGVSRIGLFGSFVRDQVVANSDLDVLVEFETGKKTFDNFMELANFLEDTTARDVDLLTPESLSPYIGPRILEEVEYYAF
ncbi:MAG: nucleotidyltransferase [Spirochaetes bacterium GWB1_59_5]|nr:MAG: nucleotidyltransferase [Spirochaetes bacterium GWB1_59_5]